MVKFACICRKKFNQLCKSLERTLGPDTGDLAMKFGLHSGPVTAGVLRGEKARFQLFGDTVNTASRMESTGAANKIQISKTTANLLIAAGKENWVKPRKDLIQAKGKGMLQTFWVASSIEEEFLSEPQKASPEHLAGDAGSDVDDDNSAVCDTKDDTMTKQDRLIDWMVDLLLGRIQMLIAIRKTMEIDESTDLVYIPPPGACLDEIKETIPSQACDVDEIDCQSVELSDDVIAQVRELVSIVALMYRANSFHNFEHSCHVSMSVNKLLKRIAAVDTNDSDRDGNKSTYNFMHSILSDPLALLAIVFSALIHDIDHRGVSNVQLVKEEEWMAETYKNKSVAEQNSVDIAWSMLMSERFTTLRQTIFTSIEEVHRFRQIIVNVVLATDIFDTELNDLRKLRWNNVFSEFSTGGARSNDELKATIVIEYIIQASDVSHTMQHWHVFCKWNRRLFVEMYTAYCEGRLQKDPCEFWYDGEISFFDNYVIPLAKKLRDCNVFGVSSEELLLYAENNREEWKERGKDFVKMIIEEDVPYVRRQLCIDDDDE